MKYFILFFSIVTAYICLDFISHKYLLNYENIQRILIFQMESNRISNSLNVANWNLSTERIIFMLVYSFIKVGASLMIITTGFYLFDIKLKIKDLFIIVALSEFVFIIQILIEILCYNTFSFSTNLTQLYHYSPFSLISLFNIDTLPNYLIYPLENLGVFEVLYVFTIALLSVKIGAPKVKQNFQIVFLSYFSSLFVWFSVHILLKLL